MDNRKIPVGPSPSLYPADSNPLQQVSPAEVEYITLVDNSTGEYENGDHLQKHENLELEVKPDVHDVTQSTSRFILVCLNGFNVRQHYKAI